MSKHFHNLKVKDIIKETINTVSIVFDVPNNLKDDFKYDAGQYLTIKTIVNGEDIRRSYSISSWSDQGEELKVSSKMIDDGKMSSFLFNNLKVGEELAVMPPMGNFTMKGEQMNKTAVFFAGGSGITPIISLIKKALQEGKQNLYLHYGNRDQDQSIFEEELKQLKEKSNNRLLVQHYLDSNSERLDIERVKNIVESMKNEKNDAIFYVCGPEGMIEAAQKGMDAAGVDKDQIVIEYFASPTQASNDPDTITTVISGEVNDITIVIDDEEHQITTDDGEFILDAAERIGVDPPFSCRSGVCTTCKAKLLSGEVVMENNFGLSDDEIEEGYILTCIGKPKTPGVKVSWDDV